LGHGLQYFFDRENCLDLVAFAAHNAAFDQQWLPPDVFDRGTTVMPSDVVAPEVFQKTDFA
jgi:hypothetical protein